MTTEQKIFIVGIIAIIVVLLYTKKTTFAIGGGGKNLQKEFDEKLKAIEDTRKDLAKRKGQCGANWSGALCEDNKCCSKNDYCVVQDDNNPDCYKNFGCQVKYGFCFDNDKELHEFEGVFGNTWRDCGPGKNICPKGWCCNMESRLCSQDSNICKYYCDSEWGDCYKEAPKVDTGRETAQKCPCPSGQCCALDGNCYKSSDRECLDGKCIPEKSGKGTCILPYSNKTCDKYYCNPDLFCAKQSRKCVAMDSNEECDEYYSKNCPKSLPKCRPQKCPQRMCCSNGLCYPKGDRKCKISSGCIQEYNGKYTTCY